MFEDMKPEQAAERAADYFGDNYHCAEAVVAACIEALGVESQDAISHATAFGGGFGRTFMETCGVLSGSMIVIGHLFGRRQAGESWDISAELGAVVRDKFLTRHDTSNCLVLRDRFGEEEQMDECRELVKKGVMDLLNFLQSEACVQICTLHQEAAGNGNVDRKKGENKT